MPLALKVAGFGAMLCVPPSTWDNHSFFAMWYDDVVQGARAQPITGRHKGAHTAMQMLSWAPDNYWPYSLERQPALALALTS